MIGDQKRSCEDGFGTVPLLFDFEEILTASLADLGSLYHAQLFCHIHSELMVCHFSYDASFALILNSLNFERVEIPALNKAIFTHSRKPILIGGLDFKCCVKLPSADSRLVVFKIYGDHNVIHFMYLVSICTRQIIICNDSLSGAVSEPKSGYCLY